MGKRLVALSFVATLVAWPVWSQDEGSVILEQETAPPPPAAQPLVDEAPDAAPVEDGPALLDRLIDPGYKGRPERAIVFHVEAWDVNCPQHITRRLTEEEIDPEIHRLRGRITELEARVVSRRGS